MLKTVIVPTTLPLAQSPSTAFRKWCCMGRHSLFACSLIVLAACSDSSGSKSDAGKDASSLEVGAPDSIAFDLSSPETLTDARAADGGALDAGQPDTNAPDAPAVEPVLDADGLDVGGLDLGGQILTWMGHRPKPILSADDDACTVVSQLVPVTGAMNLVVGLWDRNGQRLVRLAPRQYAPVAVCPSLVRSPSHPGREWA